MRTTGKARRAQSMIAHHEATMGERATATRNDHMPLLKRMDMKAIR
jgi:hypothetical protein